MNKSELRAMIREEVQQEVYSILPGLIKEALANVVGRTRRPARVKPSRMVAEAVGTPKEFDEDAKLTLRERLGYGDMTPGKAAVVGRSAQPVMEVAGVPVAGGIRAREAAAGLGHLSNMSWDEGGSVVGPDAGADVTAGVGAVDSGGDVPMALVAALGSRSKKVLDEVNRKSNWRPGMKK